MTKLLTVSAALLLCASVSQTSLAQGRSGEAPGHDRGGHRAQARDDHPGKGRGRDGPGEGKDNNRREDRAGPRARPDDGRDNRGPNDRRADNRRADDRRPVVTVEDRSGRDRDRDSDRDRSRQVVVVPWRNYELLRGCPPGLAKKGNGCLPPGQAKKIERARYDLAWRAPRGDVIYRYDNGYQYRYDRQGSLLGYLPALGGVLGIGNVWPTQFAYDPAPAYVRDYFGLSQPYDYRYADGALYGVDPQTSAIRSVVALLTGQTPSVGQRMPAGYDIYNVPYPYRDRYVDGPGALYRYNDGAIYQLDPTTQVIQAVIQLLA
jgi:hypothetical protein